jgi:hypothetical protein
MFFPSPDAKTSARLRNACLSTFMDIIVSQYNVIVNYFVSYCHLLELQSARTAYSETFVALCPWLTRWAYADLLLIGITYPTEKEKPQKARYCWEFWGS